jgi:hypothetical protein
MDPNGTLVVLVQIDNSFKRVSITPSPETSTATLFGGAPASNPSR